MDAVSARSTAASPRPPPHFREARRAMGCEARRSSSGGRAKPTCGRSRSTVGRYGAVLWSRSNPSTSTTSANWPSGVPSAARRAYRERLRQVFKYAVANRRSRSPRRLLEEQPHEPAERVTWERTHAAAFLLAARETRLYPLFYLALTSGLRAGELLGLQWSDLDLDAGTLTVRHTWAPGENGYGLGKPKTTARSRTIPLSADALEVLVAWRTAWLAERVYEVGWTSPTWTSCSRGPPAARRAPRRSGACSTRSSPPPGFRGSRCTACATPARRSPPRRRSDPGALGAAGTLEDGDHHGRVHRRLEGAARGGRSEHGSPAF